MRYATALALAMLLAALSWPAQAVLSWREQSVPTIGGRTPILYTIAAASPSVAWAAGSQGRANEALYAAILKTSDGGATWTIQYAPQVCCEVVALSAASTSTVWAVRSNALGGSDILKGVDGGSAWVQQTSTSTPLWSIAAASESVAWAVGTGGRIVATADGGLTWTERVAHTNFPDWPTNATLWDVSAVSATVGWAVGDSGLIVKTSDGGATWVIQASIANRSVFPERFLAVKGVSPDVAWAVGIGGALFKTVNGGTEWFRQYPPTADYTDVTAVSTTHAWLVAGVEGGVTRIVATHDGGSTWTTQYLDTHSSERRIGAIAAATAQDVWAVSTGQILKLTDPTGLLRSYLPLVPRGSGV